MGNRLYPLVRQHLSLEPWPIAILRLASMRDHSCSSEKWTRSGRPPYLRHRLCSIPVELAWTPHPRCTVHLDRVSGTKRRNSSSPFNEHVDFLGKHRLMLCHTAQSKSPIVMYSNTVTPSLLFPSFVQYKLYRCVYPFTMLLGALFTFSLNINTS
jgi:hypothetical protein